MEVFTPWIGVTSGVSDQLEIVVKHPEKVVAQLLIMCGYGHESDAGEGISHVWHEQKYWDRDVNVAQELLDYFEREDYRPCGSGGVLRLGYFITIINPNPDNKFDLVAIVRHGRMVRSEGLTLLKLLAESNILTVPVDSVLFPASFIHERYDSEIKEKQCDTWTQQMWDDYIKYILAHSSELSSLVFGLNDVKVPYDII